MDPTPRRRRRSKENDPPDMSQEPARGNVQEEEQKRLRREEEERLRREEEEITTIEKFVQEYPGMKSELDKIIKQLRKIGDSIIPVNRVTQGGAVFAVGGLAALSLVTLGASMLVGSIVSGIAAVGGIAFMVYINNTIQRLGEQIETDLADVCVSVSAAIKAVSKISKIPRSVLDRAPNLKKVHGAIESNPGLMRLVEDVQSSAHTGTAAALRDPLSQSAVPAILDAILYENVSVKAAQIEECVRQVESELEAVDKMYSEMQKLVRL